MTPEQTICDRMSRPGVETMRFAKNCLIFASIALGFASLSGAADAPAPIGRLVDLGGFRLHVHCTGQGKSMVVIENGLADFSFDWLRVQTEVADAPAPIGRLVDLSGFRLHVHCTGQGKSMVVIENGLGDFSFDWLRVQTEVADFARVCTYDRAGYAW